MRPILALLLLAGFANAAEQAPRPPQAPPETVAAPTCNCAPGCDCGCPGGVCKCDLHAQWRSEGWVPGTKDRRYWYLVGPELANRIKSYDEPEVVSQRLRVERIDPPASPIVPVASPTSYGPSPVMYGVQPRMYAPQPQIQFQPAFQSAGRACSS